MSKMNSIDQEMQVIDQPNAIRHYRLLALRSALGLEILGTKKRGKSAYSIIKREFGFKGTREAVRTQLCELIEKEKGIN